MILLSGLTSCHFGEKRVKAAENHLQLAYSLVEKCDYRRALNHLLKGIKFQSNNFLIRHTLAVVYFSLKEYSLSVKELNKLLKNHPHITEARLTLAITYLELNKIEEALKELTEAQKDKTYAKPLKLVQQKGLAYFKNGELFKARKFFNEVYSVSEARDCFTLMYLGRIALKLNRVKEAEKFLKEATGYCSKTFNACDKKNYNFHYFLAQLYLKKNQKKKMKYHLKIFLKQTDKKNEFYPEAQKLFKSIDK